MLGTLYWFWYPAPYFLVSQAAYRFALLAGIQLVLGPILTWLLYTPGKKGLWLDMTVISLLQVAALGWGIKALHDHRPAFMVHTLDRFELVSHSQLDRRETRGVPLRSLTDRGPLLVVTSLPGDNAGLQSLVDGIVFGNAPDIHLRPELWSDYPPAVPRILRNARTLDDLQKARPETSAGVAAAVRETGWSAPELRFLPLAGRDFDYAVYLDPENGRILGAFRCIPWL